MTGKDWLVQLSTTGRRLHHGLLDERNAVMELAHMDVAVLHMEKGEKTRDKRYRD